MSETYLENEKNQVIRSVTAQLLAVSVPTMNEALERLEANYNPYHRVYYPFSLLFQKTDFPELGKDRLASCNSPHRKRIPELIMIKGYKINLNQILDNGNYYMRPVDRLAKDAGYEGAFIEDYGISFTIPRSALTPALQAREAEYQQILARYQLSPAEIENLEETSYLPIGGNQERSNTHHLPHPTGYAWRKRGPKYIRKVFTGEMPPLNFLHKLRRDLSRYYSDLGYGQKNSNFPRGGSTEQKTISSLSQNRSCDLYYHKERGVMILKIFP